MRLTPPAAQSAIHVLPIWEPGVVGSLYGMVSWLLNSEFFSPSLAAVCPWLDRPDRQLCAVVNLLHGMGRTVGMDVIPHTDRFSEMALAFPEHFEWLRRRDLRIVDHSGISTVWFSKKYMNLYSIPGRPLRGTPCRTRRKRSFSPHAPKLLACACYLACRDAAGRLSGANS